MIRKTYNTQALMTLEEVAALEGVSRARIQQIEQRALKKLRAVLDLHGLSFSDMLQVTKERVVYD